MFKTPPSVKAPASTKSAGLSTMEKLVRYAEKDDLLLYMTALFGILMPGIMYFLYKKAHTSYLEYSNVREEQKKTERQRKKESNKKLELTIFTCGTGTRAKKLAYDAAERLEDIDPLVVKLVETDFNGFQHYKGVCLFIVGAEEETVEPAECTALFEWLKETKFNKKKTLLSNILFSVLIITPKKEKLEEINTLLANFKKCMNDVGAQEVCDSSACIYEKIKEYFDVWMTEIRYNTKRLGMTRPAVRRRKKQIQQSSDDSATESDRINGSSEESDHEKFD
uniref:Flavodoxin-like domain-containing protein n=1 Tax=Panagrolaimus superbus TaxID=310955 RepID=A0A914YVS6_9BILA